MNLRQFPPPLLLLVSHGFATFLTTLMITGCTVGPRYLRPAATTAPAFKEVEPQVSSDGTTWEIARPNDNPLPEQWWKIFHEPELDDLEEKLNSSNQSIAQAYQNFMAARAQEIGRAHV